MSVSSVQPAQAISSTSVHGAWQLLSYDVEEQANGNTFAPMGDNPSGYVIFTAEGRLSFMLSAEGRQPGSNAEERSALLSSMIAYTGTYRLEGDRWITQVDVAWNPEWVGTEQTRYFAIDGDVLTVHTPWRVMPNWPEKGLTRSICSFSALLLNRLRRRFRSRSRPSGHHRRDGAGSPAAQPDSGDKRSDDGPACPRRRSTPKAQTETQQQPSGCCCAPSGRQRFSRGQR